uniref:Uncharacterized protein n=1 Tax=viral metagenome TaxID=1070528 RepID=A0A6C0JDF2_9ZZZZ
MDYLYIVLLMFFVTIIIASLVNESFQNYYIAQPTKCFSCEKELPAKLKYLGGPTKCFSCEKEMAARYGMEYSDLAQPTKCFSCEAQMGKLIR